MSSLFDLDEGARQRDKALAILEPRISEQWRHEVLMTILTIAKVKAEFTVADVWHDLGRAPNGNSTMGVMMKQAIRNKWIEPTGLYAQSPLPDQHLRPLRVWRSLIQL